MNLPSLKFNGAIYRLHYQTSIPETPSEGQLERLYRSIRDVDKRSDSYDGDVVQFFTFGSANYVATGSEAESLMDLFHKQKETRFYDVFINSLGSCITKNVPKIDFDWYA